MAGGGTAAGAIPTGTYWDQRTWELARSAYVADLDTDPTSPDAFVGWLTRAIDTHAGLSPATRSRLAAKLNADNDEQGARKFSKTHPFPAETIDTLEEAIVADRRELGRVVSRSGFLREAVLVAAGKSRERLGRELPPAPARLPNRPPRR